MIDTAIIGYAFSQVPYTIYLRWGVLIVMSVVFGIALLKQNKHMTAIHDDISPAPALDYTLKTAKARGLIAFILWCLFAVLVIYNDVNQQIIRIHAYSRDGQPQHAASPRAIASAAPIINTEPLNEESSLNDIKSSYEDAFVSYMLLQGCNATDNAVYTKLNNKLMAALAPFDSPTLHAHNIVIAASGTYSALYAHTPCEAQYIDPTQENLAAFVK
jgi:hypothetical protein